MVTFEDYDNAELEELAEAHLASLRALMQSYAVLHVEGVDRRIPSFLSSDLNLLSEDERQPVVSHLKTLKDDQLVEAINRYKDMPTCLRLTLNEIKRRLKER